MINQKFLLATKDRQKQMVKSVLVNNQRFVKRKSYLAFFIKINKSFLGKLGSDWKLKRLQKSISKLISAARCI